MRRRFEAAETDVYSTALCPIQQPKSGNSTRLQKQTLMHVLYCARLARAALPMQDDPQAAWSLNQNPLKRFAAISCGLFEFADFSIFRRAPYRSDLSSGQSWARDTPEVVRTRRKVGGGAARAEHLSLCSPCAAVQSKLWCNTALPGDQVRWWPSDVPAQLVQTVVAAPEEVADSCREVPFLAGAVCSTVL